MIRLVLIGCGRSKLDRPAPARDLYTGPLFRAAVADVEARGAVPFDLLAWSPAPLKWAILSASHGVIEPAREIEPYDQTMAETFRAQRCTCPGHDGWCWGYGMRTGIGCRIGQTSAVVVEVHAGADYVRAVRMARDRRPFEVEEPLRGMEIGERLGWYATRRRTTPGEQLGLFREAA